MPMAAKKYSNIFRKLANENDIAFEEYLTDQQLDVLGLLIKMGLNQDLITPSNYEEIKSIAENVVSTEYYPVVQHSGKKEFTICDIDEDKDSIISISKNMFSFRENVVYEDGFDEFTRQQIVKFILDDSGNITRLAYDCTEKNYDHKSSPESIETKGIRTTTNFDGEVLSEGHFDLKINQKLKAYDYVILDHTMTYQDITDYLNVFSQLLSSHRIKTKNVELHMCLGNEEVSTNNGFTNRRVLDKKDKTN